MKIAVVVGHNARRKGARAGAPLNTNEYDYNNKIADRMIALASGSTRARKFLREPSNSYRREIEAVYREVDAYGADVSIELHFNSAPFVASGTETLSSGSTRSMALAEAVQGAMVETLGLRDRRVKVPAREDRGGWSLHAGRAPAILVEPFFGSNPADCRAAHSLGIKGMAEMYLLGTSRYAGSEAEAEPTPAATASGGFLADVDIVYRGLTRKQFFRRNRAGIRAILERINANLEAKAHGEPFNELTAIDAFSIMNARMGLRGGKANPRYVHPNGHRGLLPLPPDLRTWNGPESADPQAGMTVERNVKEFLLYLANLKNKDVGVSFSGGTLYHDLFTQEGVAGSPTKQMAILSAAVQGYFDAGHYSLRVPYSEISEKVVAAGDDANDLIEFLSELGYQTAVKDPAAVESHIADLREGIAIAG